MTTFRDALLRMVDAPGGPSLREVALRAGVSYDQLKKLRQRETATTNVDDAVKIARVFGLTVEQMIGDDSIADRVQAIELYNQLSSDERRLLQDAARGRSVRDREEDR